MGNRYSEDNFIHNFSDDFQQGGEYSDHIASHKEELRKEEISLIKN